MAGRDVHLFVFDGLSDWEYGFAVAGINNPDFQREPGRYRVRTAGLGQETVASMGGVRIVPDMVMADISPSDSAMLILPGGKAWETGEVAAAAETARAFVAAGVPVAAICGATFGLAKAGLLDNRRHTSNALEYLLAAGYQGAGCYEDAPAVTGEGLITASGVAPLEFAREIFRALTLFSPDVLDAWYNLFKTGRPEFFFALLRAAESQDA